MQVELEHVQAMDYNMNSSSGYGYVVEFDDVCPVCNYGIDMSKGAFHIINAYTIKSGVYR